MPSGVILHLFKWRNITPIASIKGRNVCQVEEYYTYCIYKGTQCVPSRGILHLLHLQRDAMCAKWRNITLIASIKGRNVCQAEEYYTYCIYKGTQCVPSGGILHLLHL